MSRETHKTDPVAALDELDALFEPLRVPATLDEPLVSLPPNPQHESVFSLVRVVWDFLRHITRLGTDVADVVADHLEGGHDA